MSVKRNDKTYVLIFLSQTKSDKVKTAEHCSGFLNLTWIGRGSAVWYCRLQLLQ